MIVKKTLSSRERVKLALEHKETDRIPIAMVCSGINQPARQVLEDYLQAERGTSVDAYLNPRLDIADIAPEYIGPQSNNGADIWGVRRKPVFYGSGEYNEIDYYPLAEAETAADLDRHTWPSADWFDYSVLPGMIRTIRQERDRAIIIGNGNIFERSWYMRGFEKMFMDFVLNQELAHAILDRVTAFFCEYFNRILSTAPGEIDLIFTADDIAGQNGLLMSLPMWEEFIKPCHTRLNKVIHEHGAKVIYHSDGAVTEAIPGLMDMGIDILQALQFSADGMDPQVLKTRHGKDLCFEGGVSVQTTLPFGTRDKVEAEVKNLITVLGKNGGYILGPSHVIQAGTPPENIVALFNTAINYYPF